MHMRWKGKIGLGLLLALGGSDMASAQTQPMIAPIAVVQTAPAPTIVVQAPAAEAIPAPAPAGATPPIVGPITETVGEQVAAEEGAPPEPSLGPTPLTKVGILQGLLFGDDADKAFFHIAGWIEADQNWRNTGHGINNIAPVMNRFGDEFLLRQAGIYLWKPLDPKCWSWGFNAIFIAGSDASFLGPTAGGWANTNPRFGGQFTDLNVTFHAPVLTEGGIDFKIGRQTTILGPMGALAWQRPFGSSDYAWYNLEEGRYTGVSSVWHVSKRLDWYNGIEFGWGEFFDYYSPAPQYITNISYWLDEEAKNTKVWTTLLVGPTGMQGTGNTTILELGLSHNYNKYFYQILDTQLCWSRCPIFGPKPPGYDENAYDVYTYLGAHLNACWDVNARIEWYYDQNGGGYPGGFGIPNNNYYNVTVGPDWHPVKWLQVRPEVRYDWATKDAFGTHLDKKNQLCVDLDVLIKF
jgi:hypothetical protein